ncbi:hypothetical protein [Novosphingobium sp.]|uniref:hypothetical protein n=1 Tax=Novosphingobium sp. TaxID=1874826 RepID=UPI0035B292BB
MKRLLLFFCIALSNLCTSPALAQNGYTPNHWDIEDLERASEQAVTGLKAYVALDFATAAQYCPVALKALTEENRARDDAKAAETVGYLRVCAPDSLAKVGQVEKACALYAENNYVTGVSGFDARGFCAKAEAEAKRRDQRENEANALLARFNQQYGRVSGLDDSAPGYADEVAQLRTTCDGLANYGDVFNAYPLTFSYYCEALTALYTRHWSSGCHIGFKTWAMIAPLTRDGSLPQGMERRNEYGSLLANLAGMHSQCEDWGYHWPSDPKGEWTYKDD